MWSSRLFWKLFLAYAGLILLAVSACVAIVSGWQEEQLVEQIQRRLQVSATLLRSDIESLTFSDRSEELQKKVRALGQQTDTRLTLVANDGKVLADSEQPTLEAVASMENHLGRQEFVIAARNGEGASHRNSPTLGIPFLYFALRLEREGNSVGFVRAAQSVASIHAEVSAIRRLIWLVGFVVGISALIVTYWLTARIIRPIAAMKNAAELIAAGQYEQRIDVQQNDELGVLARSFELMSQQLSARESQLREGIQRQTTILRAMAEGVIALDDRSRILFANMAAGKVLGFEPDRVIGRALLEIVRNHELHDVVQKTLNSRRLCESEIRIHGPTVLNLNVLGTPLPGEPCRGVVLVLRDMTQLKQLENLRQQFVANVSHELKTPLSSIKAYTETLLNGASEDPQHSRRFLLRIEEQSERLHRLILDMLSLAHIESGQTALELTKIPLSRVVHQCVEYYLPQSEAAGIALQNEIGDCLLNVYAEEEGLLQILSNLVDNAIKYTPPGGAVTVRCCQEENDLVIEIADTGIGIAPEHLNRLFERFYRVDKARSRELGGTGLGLAIVKHLSQAMGGGVTVDSTIEKGSIFRVQLPLATM